VTDAGAGAGRAGGARVRRGFTLVEVMVALLIMAVLATMAWQGIDAIARARDGGQAQLDRTLRLATVIAQWDQDLQAVQDIAVVPALAFDGSTLRVVRAAEGGVQLVAWTLQSDRWQRWAGPVVTRVAELQESWMRSQQLVGGEPGMVPLLDGVESVQIYFYRGNSWSNAQSSGDVDAGAGSGAPGREQLPSGVRLVLEAGGEPLTRDLIVPVQTR
jgi:general secretion pathway protein J